MLHKHITKYVYTNGVIYVICVVAICLSPQPLEHGYPTEKLVKSIDAIELASNPYASVWVELDKLNDEQKRALGLESESALPGDLILVHQPLEAILKITSSSPEFCWTDGWFEPAL